LLEQLMEGDDRFGRGRRSLGRDRLDLQRLRQPLDGRSVDWQRSGWLAEGLRLQPEGIERKDGNERQQQDRCNERDPLQRLQKSTLS
jgi:hypothetical protein